jgi:hypothetical protein
LEAVVLVVAAADLSATPAAAFPLPPAKTAVSPAPAAISAAEAAAATLVGVEASNGLSVAAFQISNLRFQTMAVRRQRVFSLRLKSEI